MAINALKLGIIACILSLAIACMSSSNDLRRDLAQQSRRNNLGVITVTNNGWHGFDFERKHHEGLLTRWLSNPRLAPDGKAFVAVEENGSASAIVLVDFTDGRVVSLDADIRARVLALSPDRTRIAFAGSFRRHHTSTRSTASDWTYGLHYGSLTSVESIELGIETTHGMADDWGGLGTYGLSWCPDNRSIVFSQNGSIVLFDTADRSRRTIASGVNPSCAPSGSWIAYKSREESAALISPDGHTSKVLMNGRTIAWGVQWSPDSRYLLFDQDTLGFRHFSVYRLADGAVTDAYWPFGAEFVRDWGWAFLPKGNIDILLPPMADATHSGVQRVRH